MLKAKTILHPILLLLFFALQGVRGEEPTCDYALEDPQKYIRRDYTGFKGYDNDTVYRAKLESMFYKGCSKFKYCFSPETGKRSTLTFPTDTKMTDNRDECLRGRSCWIAAGYGDTQHDKYHDEWDEIPNPVELVGKAESWISITFAKTYKRRAAYQVECMLDPYTGNVEIWDSYYTNEGEYTPRRKVHRLRRLPRLNYSGAAAGIIYCRFWIKKQVHVKLPDKSRLHFDFENEKYVFMLAKGDDGLPGVQGYIEMQYQCMIDPGWKSGPHNFSKFIRSHDWSRENIVLHARHMIYAFFFVIPVGTFYVRYYKAVQEEECEFAGFKVWLLVHVIAEIIAYLIILRGLQFAAIAKEKGWSPRPWNVHRIVGTFCCSLRLAHLMFFSIFRTDIFPQYPTLGMWELKMMVHQITGYLIFAITLAEFYFLNLVRYSGFTCQTRAYIMLFWVVNVFFHLLMTYYYFGVAYLSSFESIAWQPKGYHRLLTTFQARINVLDWLRRVFHHDHHSNNQPFNPLRIAILVVFVVAMLIITVRMSDSIVEGKLIKEFDVCYFNHYMFWSYL